MTTIGFGRRLLFGLFAAFIGGAGGTMAAGPAGLELGQGAVLFGALGFVAGVLFGAAGLRMARWIA